MPEPAAVARTAAAGGIAQAAWPRVRPAAACSAWLTGLRYYRGRRVNTAVTRDPPGPEETLIWSASCRVSHRP